MQENNKPYAPVAVLKTNLIFIRLVDGGIAFAETNVVVSCRKHYLIKAIEKCVSYL